MREAKEGDRVKLHYTGRLEDGTVFDSSEKRPPFDFTIGDGKIMPRIENGVIGMTMDSETHVEIPSEEAFGDRREELVVELDRKIFPEALEPKIGQRLNFRQSDGRSIGVTVLDIKEDSVTVDGNHPLAGRTLIFDLKLVEIS